VKVDYDRVAPTYDGRYRDGGPLELISFVRTRCAEAGDRAVLEIGCGTGRWLVEALQSGARAVGLDPSAGMLDQARARLPEVALVRGRAEALPFRDQRFGAVLCVYVVHHLQDAARAVAEAARVLDRDGRLAIVALAPHDGQDRWYLYDYFPGTREADVVRYPTTAAIAGWMTSAGLVDVRIEVAARLAGTASGPAVFDDPILSRHGTCQLSLLDDAAFERGMRRVRADAASVPPVEFVTDLRLFATTGRKPAG
jgi:ubiquinone/menaquinone biosynthesis C-methylase UbiE